MLDKLWMVMLSGVHERIDLVKRLREVFPFVAKLDLSCEADVNLRTQPCWNDPSVMCLLEMTSRFQAVCHISRIYTEC